MAADECGALGVFQPGFEGAGPFQRLSVAQGDAHPGWCKHPPGAGPDGILRRTDELRDFCQRRFLK